MLCQNKFSRRKCKILYFSSFVQIYLQQWQDGISFYKTNEQILIFLLFLFSSQTDDDEDIFLPPVPPPPLDRGKFQ